MGVLKRAQEFFGEVLAEFRKVTWPNRQELINSTVVVITVTVVIAFFWAAWTSCWRGSWKGSCDERRSDDGRDEQAMVRRPHVLRIREQGQGGHRVPREDLRHDGEDHPRPGADGESRRG